LWRSRTSSVSNSSWVRRSSVRSPPTTAVGGLFHHVNQTRAVGERFQPTNINFGLLPPLDEAHKKKERKQRMADRALRDLDSWAGASVDRAA
jgi:methylenetetrahydrofolate--tRNA-(uracil-5-)-methyltransferase